MRKSSEPLVSIIIPCFNYADYLPETINSVLNQTYKNLEIIIVDDGSIDQTKDLSQKFSKQDSRIRYFYQKNNGTSSAKNFGIEVSTGDFIQFLDADDILLPNKIGKQVQYFKKDRNLDIVYGDARFFESETKKLYKNYNLTNYKWMPEVSGFGEKIIKELAYKNMMVICAPLVKKSSLLNVGIFDKRLKYCEDWDLWLRCAINKLKFRFSPERETISLIRVHSKSATVNTTQMCFSYFQMSAKYLEDTSICEKYKKLLRRFQKVNLKLFCYLIMKKNSWEKSKTFYSQIKGEFNLESKLLNFLFRIPSKLLMSKLLFVYKIYQILVLKISMHSN